MNSIKEADTQLKHRVPDIPGIPKATFTYVLTKPLGSINPGHVVQRGLDNISEILPYVMSFVPRVRSVKIIDRRQGRDEAVGYRCVERSEGHCAIEVQKGGIIDRISIWLAKQNETEVAVRVHEGHVVPYPESMARLFKGFPLVGTERFPFPVVVNTLKFRTTIERDGIELSDNDRQNRDAIKDGVKAFGLLLDRLASGNVTKQYNVASQITGGVFAVQQATQWYGAEVVPQLVDTLTGRCIVTCASGRRPLGECHIPYMPKDKKSVDYLKGMYGLLRPIFSDCLPVEDEAVDWYDRLGFDRFKGLGFNLEQLVEWVADKGSLSGLPMMESSINWLNRLIAFVLEHDRALLDKHAIVPNQVGEFKTLKDELYWDRGVDPRLIETYRILSGVDFHAILLHKEFMGHSTLLPEEKGKSTKNLARVIDDTLQDESRNPGYPVAIGLLFEWLDEPKRSEDEITELFPWFASRRPQLLLNTFTPSARINALAIVRSGKVEALAELASSDLSSEEIDQIAKNPDIVRSYLRWLESRVDDEEHADEDRGDHGEEIVYHALRNRFPESEGYDVDWASKRGEGRFDFVVKQLLTGEELWYVDAKTTSRGMGNSDTIPFFMRRSQWQFLQDPAVRDKYWLARVFMANDGPNVSWLRISRLDKIE